MKRPLKIFIFAFLLLASVVKGQVQVPDTIVTKQDTALAKAIVTEVADTILKMQDSLRTKPFKPDPMKAVWMGVIIPGYGQVYNQKYWKLPIVYGGFLGCAYAISWNGSHYNTYRKAYRDITDTDPATNSFLDILPKGVTIGSPGIGDISTYTTILKSKQDNFRRFRDMSIIVSIAYYALTLVDAYVDAQLYDFDISTDLSMRFQPILLENRYGRSNTLGVQCCFSLK